MTEFVGVEVLGPLDPLALVRRAVALCCYIAPLGQH